ncbi:uncharacterized protein LOC110899286 isoform X2 [Helianthus annuus]|uniref:uncharacterized protein LOC110899286 isoform X2 n=1 Tax=Helianthus annuus TaxID=4232 RepID=UPI000B8F88F5|nr:uncharacterized protein LOC110899286 isoform X2 [Helianthus annuus]
MNNEAAASNTRWLYDSPVNSDVEAKLRSFLLELKNTTDKILGIQVCAYKDGKVIIDTAAGVLGKDDPRPVQPDSLFNCFSVTKAVTAGMIHWLADKGKLKLDENVANVWPEFGTNGKDQIKHASGKKFQDILEEAIVRPLDVEGELYIGIPPGVESRLATLTIDKDDIILLDPEHQIQKSNPFSAFMPSSYTLGMVSSLIPLSNTLNARRSIQPAGNGHFSARALARYYAALVDGGVVPPRHLQPIKSHPTSDEVDTKIFPSPKERIHDAFLGSGDYKDLILPNGAIGLGFVRFSGTDGSVIGFGHGGLGGSMGYCDINNRFAIAVTINKLSLGALTGEILRFVCSELDLPIPQLSAEPSTK